MKILKFFLLSICLIILFGCSNDDQKYLDIKKQENEILIKVKDWVRYNNVSLEDKIVIGSPRFLQRGSSLSSVIVLSLKGESDKTFERLLVSINGNLIKAKLWTFKFNEAQDSYAFENLTVHQILRNFTGTLIINDLEINSLSAISYINGNPQEGESARGGNGNPHCSRCHNGILDEVVVVGGGGSSNGGWPSNPTNGPMINPGVPTIPIPIFGGGETMPTEPNIDDSYPDCNSFNYIKKTNLPWQEAAVKNINFNIIVVETLTPLRFRVVHIAIPQAVSFQMPTNLAIGNTNITPGAAALSTANSLESAMNITKNYFKSNIASDTQIYYYFAETLKNEFEMSNPGARFQLNPANTVTPTEYKTNWFGPGDCN
ncbi:hypothetical protein [Flavobacterium sp. '19STA2R22 D10 B1']|uniref:hypothetical protein n=1 Tax=Flavobacterium aerium TaxID=3037261 RepID=UPI00278BBE53|nr:hypothetical protein [Flavobacterium sp. '19STA2R22 D10 B1']